MAESKENSEILEQLKAAVLNIDWEISDKTLGELNQEIATLQTLWVGEKVLLVYLQILGALCQYISTSREKSHPGTFLLLKESFEGLETVVLNPEMDQAEKSSNVMLYAERYNLLKKEIASGDFIPGPVTKEEPEDEKSTMETLLDDEEDHSTDTVFDSMLNTMVHAPEDEDEDEDGDTGASEDDPKPDAVPEVPATPPARPAVVASFNKADGTEVEPNRNEEDEFAEADDLLDDFFDDDDIPAPGQGPASDDEIFDLNEMLDDDDDSLEVDASEQQSDDELVIELDEDSDVAGEDDSFQEMENTLDDFFGDDDDDDLLDPVVAEEDDTVIDEALDDFFDEDDTAGDSDPDDEPEDASDAAGDIEPQDELRLEEDESEDSLVLDADVDVEVTEAEVSIDEVPLESRSEDDSEIDKDDIEIVVDPSEIPEIEEPQSSLVVGEETATEYVVNGADIVPDDQDEVSGAVSCVENLQMLLLSVEWEVDDKLLHRLEEEVESLAAELKDNALACVHLKFLGTIIRYIGREQADVIGESMTCLKLIADSLESLVADQAVDLAHYCEEATHSFVDWHELVVLDFEKRVSEEVASLDSAVDEVVESVDLSPEMKALKDSILQEVKVLVAQEVLELKG